MPTLRLFFFALLLANVAFFAWQKNAGPAEGHEPQRLQQEIEPDKLRLILPEKPVPAPVPEDKKAEASATEVKAAEAAAKPAEAGKSEPVKADAVKSDAAARKTEAAPTLLCKSFAGFTPESARAAQTAINSSSPATQVVLVTSKESTSYWVHIPPQSSKAGADKKVAELKEMGVSDSFIISDDGPNKWAVSLGLFKSKDMADNYLQKLVKQGVRSAKIEVRDRGTEKVRLEVTAPAEALGVLAREIKPLAGATLGECKPAEAARN